MKKSPIINYLRNLRVRPSLLGRYTLAREEGKLAPSLIRDPGGWWEGAKIASRTGRVYRVHADGSLRRA